jgi:tRNA A37 methylthiotransferase MiaB
MYDIIEQIKTIASRPQNSKTAIFYEAIDMVTKKTSVASQSNIYMILYSLRNYFFASMSDKEREEYINAIVAQLVQETEFVCQLIELSSILYKSLSKELQHRIFNAVFSLSANVLYSPRGIVAMSMFVKNIQRVCDNFQKSKIVSYIDSLKPSVELKDTVDYTLRILSREFTVTKGVEVLLIVPEFLSGNSFLQPPLCMMNVYANLTEGRIKVDLLDNRVFSYSVQQVCEIASNYKYVAISSSPVDQVQNYFLDYRYLHFCNLVQHLSVQDRDGKTIVCGAHVTVKSEFVLNNTDADIALLGEYDSQLAELLKGLVQHRDIFNIPNLVIKSDNGYIRTPDDSDTKHPTAWTKNIINYSILPVADYFGYTYIGNMHAKKKNWSIVQATRGCSFSCSFCFNFYGKRVRYKKIDILLNELRQLQTLGVSEVFFVDQTFTISREYTKTLCQKIIDNELSLNWSCETRADLIDTDTLDLMRRAGCSAIWLGIESFNDDALRANNKGITCNQIYSGIDLIENSGIEYRAFIMLGMFGDTSEGLRKTIDIIERKRIRLSKSIIECTPRIGTSLFDGLDKTVRDAITDFDMLDIYRGRLSDQIDSTDINEGIVRLLKLAES